MSSKKSKIWIKNSPPTNKSKAVLPKSTKWSTQMTAKTYFLSKTIENSRYPV